MATSWQFYENWGAPVMCPVVPTTAAETAIALNTAFTFGTSGVSFYWGFWCPESGNLTDFWFKVKTFSGTWASTDGVVNIQIREGINGTRKPGSTLTGSFTVTLDGVTTGWIKKTGLSIALTAGKYYTIVLGDADGGATNFCTLISRYGTSANPNLNMFGAGSSTSTDGFATSGTAGVGIPPFAVKVAGGVYASGGFSLVSTTTTSVLARGARFKPPINCTLVGAYFVQDVTFSNLPTFKLFADATLPGGSPLASFASAASAGTDSIGFMPFPAANRYDLIANTWYRFVVVPGSTLTTPRKAIIGDNPDADIIAAVLPFGGNYHWTEQVGSAWDDTQTTTGALVGPILVPTDVASAERSQVFIG